MNETTSALQEAINAALELQRPALDAFIGMRSLMIVVKFNEKTGMPRCVICTPQAENSLDR